MQRVVVPVTPGVLSAFGGLIADIKNDFIKTVYFDLEPARIDQMRRGYAALRDRALHWLYQEQGFEGSSTIIYSADLRYRGQSYEIETPLEDGWIESGDLDAIARAFHHEHKRLYEHADEEAAVQLINLRLVVVGVPPKPEFARQARVEGTPTRLS